jgi:hypothetical protein
LRIHKFTGVSERDFQNLLLPNARIACKGVDALVAAWLGIEQWICFRQTKSKKMKQWIRSKAVHLAIRSSPWSIGAAAHGLDAAFQANHDRPPMAEHFLDP